MITTSRIEYSGDPGTFYTLFSPNSPAPNADYNTPLMILGARRAVEIARRADAGRFADTELRDAELKLATLEQAWPRSRSESDLRHNAKKNSGLAHDVMRIAEQARKLSVERSAQARLSAERQQAVDNIARPNPKRTALELKQVALRAIRSALDSMPRARRPQSAIRRRALQTRPR